MLKYKWNFYIKKLLGETKCTREQIAFSHTGKHAHCIQAQQQPSRVGTICKKRDNPGTLLLVYS